MGFVKEKAYETLQNNPEDFHPLVGDTVECRVSYEDLFDLIKNVVQIGTLSPEKFPKM